MERVCLRGTLLAALIGIVACSGGEPGTAAPADCALDSITDEVEKTPGYPFNYETFKTEIAPLAVATCTNGVCHKPEDAETGTNKNFQVWAGAVDDECDQVNTFKSFRDASGYQQFADPARSSIVNALNGGLAVHPVKVGTGFEQGDLDKITAFIQAAYDACVADGQCGDNTANSVWDKNVFASTIQPAIDAAARDGATVGCSEAASCHLPPTGQLGVVLHPAPEADSPEMEENFKTVTQLIDYTKDPKTSLFYIQSSTAHSPGSGSSLIDAAGLAAIEEWTLAAKAIADEGGGVGQPEGCADPALLDVGVFENDILPILRGEKDLNNQDDEGNSVGCTRGPCHGRYKPGSFSLDPAAPVSEQLASFACYVSLTNPSNSMVLLCPTDSVQCIVPGGHPGTRIFDGAEDLNYQRILTYLFSVSNSLAVPVDFAFYARVIDPIFNNIQAVEDGEQGRACSDAVSCHGVSVQGQPPPNGANFGIIPNAGDDQERLRSNFVEAASMITFQTPECSSLFMYPTNEIANDEVNPCATGINHPGGLDFAPDSQFALDILKFAFGLRTDAAGFQNNWLVAGGFSSDDIDDDVAPFDENSIEPLIFDDNGGDDLEEWDALFEDVNVVDLDAFVGGEEGNGRTIYAVAYLLNQTTVDQDVEIIINTDNAIRLFVGPSATTNEDGGETRLEFVVPAARNGEGAPPVSRIMIKMFQAAGQGANFTAQLVRAGQGGDIPFTDDGEELVVLLNNVGSI